MLVKPNAVKHSRPTLYRCIILSLSGRLMSRELKQKPVMLLPL